METLYQRVIRQFDTLVPFLALAREEGFELIRRDCEAWFRPEQLEAVPDTYREYRCQIAHAAFLLGYSYVEAYLADVVRSILHRRPSMLPNNRQLSFRDIIERGSYDAVLDHMIEKEILTVFYNSAEEIAKYFTDRLQLPWPAYDGQPALVVASRLRNCIIHNGARADDRLAEVSDWVAAEPIELVPDEVHLFGVDARDFANQVWRAAAEKHLRTVEHPSDDAD
jgi:hypothetical protein